MGKFLTDMHNHTTFSHDGSNTAEEMLTAACKAGMAFFGVSEHFDYDYDYEAMDPETAELIYQQVVKQENYSAEIEEYAQAYSEMKPKEAAGIFEAMTDDLDLAAKILGAMQPDDRGKILGVMDPAIAARITKIMEPDS